MKRFTLMMVVLVLAAVARTETAGAQTLPGEGGCWQCMFIEGQGGGGYSPQCMGVLSGAPICHIDYIENVCWTEGSGCTTGLFDDGGVLTETLACTALQLGEPSWWMLASGRAAREEETSEMLTPPPSVLLVGAIDLRRPS